MRAAAFAIAIAAAFVAVPSAHAYELLGARWQTKTLTYHNAVPKYAKNVRAAARAWNHSGSRFRWRAAPRSRAKVRIVLDRDLGPAGLALTSFSGGRMTGARIYLRADVKSGQLTKREGRWVATAVIVHEMGHVMGLDHEDGRCATMNSMLNGRCKRPPEAWRYRCRLLERDDARGAARLYGGSPRAVGPAFCNGVAQPEAPAGVAVAPDEGGARLTFSVPAGAQTVRVLRRLGECPASADDPAAELVASEVGAAGEAVEAFDYGLDAPGRYCYAVAGIGKLGRPGPLTTVFFEHAGDPVPDTGPPVADFEWEPSFDVPLQVDFIDFSDDPDADIVAWRWTFGDGATSSEPEPSHTYAAAGSYEVTLTVTDAEGDSASATRTVDVVDEQPAP